MIHGLRRRNNRPQPKLQEEEAVVVGGGKWSRAIREWAEENHEDILFYTTVGAIALFVVSYILVSVPLIPAWSSTFQN